MKIVSLWWWSIYFLYIDNTLDTNIMILKNIFVVETDGVIMVECEIVDKN